MFYTENAVTSVELFQAQLFDTPLIPHSRLRSCSLGSAPNSIAQNSTHIH